jgi:hypothetical protein
MLSAVQDGFWLSTRRRLQRHFKTKKWASTRGTGIFRSGGQFMDYLLKTEPTVYSFANLERENVTVWDGVTNPVAVKNLRGMKAGERLVIYETGDHKSAVGTATGCGGCG